MAFLVATTSLPAVYRPNDDRWNAARSCQKKKEKEKNCVFGGHYVIASSLPPERRRPNNDRWNAARSCQLLMLLKSFLVYILFMTMFTTCLCLAHNLFMHNLFITRLITMRSKPDYVEFVLLQLLLMLLLWFLLLQLFIRGQLWSIKVYLIFIEAVTVVELAS